MPAIRAIGAAASRGLRAAAVRREAVSAVYVTVPSRDVGRSLASSLLSARLVACVNIIPVREYSTHTHVYCASLRSNYSRAHVCSSRGNTHDNGVDVNA